MTLVFWFGFPRISIKNLNVANLLETRKKMDGEGDRNMMKRNQLLNGELLSHFHRRQLLHNSHREKMFQNSSSQWERELRYLQPLVKGCLVLLHSPVCMCQILSIFSLCVGRLHGFHQSWGSSLRRHMQTWMSIVRASKEVLGRVLGWALLFLELQHLFMLCLHYTVILVRILTHVTEAFQWSDAF